MHLGLDFDNTLISYDRLFHDLAAKKLLIPKLIAQNKNAVRDYLRSIDQEDEWTMLQGEVYGQRILEAEPYPGMKNSLTQVAKKIPISIVSHKTKNPFMGKPWDLHQSARSWLEKQEMHNLRSPLISSDRVFFELTKEEKISRIVSIGCTHYVDDLPEILEMLPKSIVRIHFSPNQQVPASHKWETMRTWDELINLLKLN